MNDNLSPEEKLFKAIKDNESKQVGKFSFIFLGKAKQVISGFFHSANGFVEGIYKNFSHDDLKSKTQESSLTTYFNVDLYKKINKVFASLLFVLLLTMVFYSFRKKDGVGAIVEAITRMQASLPAKKQVESFPPAYFYTDVVSKKNIFRLEIKDKNSALANDLRVNELIKSLKIVGIYVGDEREAMIEDSAADKTYFLKRGQTIKGATIKEIGKDTITLEFKGETVELR